MDISHNLLGKIPSSVKQLVSLKSIDISYNRIYKLDNLNLITTLGLPLGPHPQSV